MTVSRGNNQGKMAANDTKLFIQGRCIELPFGESFTLCIFSILFKRLKQFFHISVGGQATRHANVLTGRACTFIFQ